jgi:hypothetical protein
MLILSACKELGDEGVEVLWDIVGTQRRFVSVLHVIAISQD